MGHHAAAVVKNALGGEIDIFVSAHASRVIDAALACDAQRIAALQRAAVLQPAVGGESQLACACAELACVAHAHAFFGAHQRDFIGIHAAERRDVHGEGRFILRLRFHLSDRARRADLITPRHHVQLLRMDLRIDGHRLGDQLRVVALGVVKPFAFDIDTPAVNVEAFQLAVLHDRRAGGQRVATSVNKAAAITGNARRVGYHDIRALACHFDKTVELARIAAVDLVEDHPRFLFAKPRVGRHHAAQLGAGIFVAVVEYRAASVNVEPGVGVAGDARCAGFLNIDLRQPVRRRYHCGLLLARRVAVRHDVRLSGQAHAARRKPERKGEWMKAYLAPDRCRAGTLTRATAAATARYLRHHHQHAAGFVKDQAI
ncbi:hypothetical protein BN133_1293 [Cronobacter dublinensis 582]|nr:hypothetical protein BN133_1293 [Cronobacter dublinensis 582]